MPLCGLWSTVPARRHSRRALVGPLGADGGIGRTGPTPSSDAMRAFAVRLTLPAILCVFGFSIAHAGAPRTHDGFMLRLSAGGGSAGSKIDDATGSIDLSGTAGEMNI